MFFLIKKFLLNLFLPIQCFRCGQPHFYFCPQCATRLELYPNQFCPFCGQSTNNGRLCPDCQKKFFLKRAVAGFFYANASIQKAVRLLKYQKVFLIARDLAQILADHPNCRPIFNQSPKAVLIPVPTTKKKEKQRGFNQATKIAQNLSLLTGLPLVLGLLLKTQETTAQAGLKNKKQRFNNLRHCFTVDDQYSPKLTPSTPLILIDDILTTGATVRACAETLFGAGFQNIQAVVLARQTVKIKNASASSIF